MRGRHRHALLVFVVVLSMLGTGIGAQAPAPATVTAIRAGRLFDPEAGRVLTNQIIVVEGTRIRDVGPSVAVPAGAQVIDLSGMTVMPGLVEAHNHLALTYKPVPENNVYYFTYVQESTALRAIQAASNGIQMLASGFTIVRDMGNNGNDADTPDEIVKAVRQNILFGAKVIKICVDCKPYGYTADEIRLFISESAKAGLKVEGHCQTVDGARRAIEAGIWSIAHDSGLNDELHKRMAQKGVWRAGTETPISLTGHTTKMRYERTVAGLRNAWQNKAPLTFSTDADYYVPGKTRGEVAIEFIETWKAAGIPPADI